LSGEKPRGKCGRWKRLILPAPPKKRRPSLGGNHLEKKSRDTFNPTQGDMS